MQKQKRKKMGKISVICSKCGGTGQLQFLDFEGFSTTSSWKIETCPVCNGSGQVEAEDFHQKKKEGNRKVNGETEQKTDKAD